MNSEKNQALNRSATDEQLNRALSGAPETQARVSERLHQDIMRSVRLAQADQGKPQKWRTLPAWAMGIATVAVVAVFVSQSPVNTPVPEPVAIPSPPEMSSTQSIFAALEEKISTLPGEQGMAEDALKKELERLKSDLRRFGIDT
jgi:anti-sigma-K factor RskA